MKLILGSMTFGEQADDATASAMLKVCRERGVNEIDTAYVYNEGRCEEMLGRVLPEDGYFSIATKANPRITGRLDGDAVRMQLNGSLKRMNVPSVHTLFLHFPDANTPVEDALRVCAELHAQGKFTTLGLSNFPAWLVVDIYHRCKAEGWPLPQVYEGVYNAISRHAERELFDMLDAYGIAFHAYNPLAGGMLTNKYTSYDQKPTDGRFFLRKTYVERYWKPAVFEALSVVRSACEEYGVTMVDAAYRWLAYHSRLSEARGDAIIIGASKLTQLEQNLVALQAGPLPDKLLDAYQNAWETCKESAPEYFRYFRGNAAK